MNSKSNELQTFKLGKYSESILEEAGEGNKQRGCVGVSLGRGRSTVEALSKDK
jgi:hypothetical protein